MPDPPQHDDPAKTLDYHYLPILAQRQEKTADRSSSSLAGAKRPDTVDVEESDGPEEVRHFDHLLTFPDEIAPVFEGLLEEQDRGQGWLVASTSPWSVLYIQGTLGK